MVETLFIHHIVAYSKEYITTSSSHSNNVILAKGGVAHEKELFRKSVRGYLTSLLFLFPPKNAEDQKNIKKTTEEVEEALGEIHTGKECSTKQLSIELNR